MINADPSAILKAVRLRNTIPARTEHLQLRIHSLGHHASRMLLHAEHVARIAPHASRPGRRSSTICRTVAGCYWYRGCAAGACIFTFTAIAGGAGRDVTGSQDRQHGAPHLQPERPLAPDAAADRQVAQQASAGQLTEQPGANGVAHGAPASYASSSLHCHLTQPSLKPGLLDSFPAPLLGKRDIAQEADRLTTPR